MGNASAAIGMKVLTLIVGIPVAKLAKQAVARVWVAARPDDPPHTTSSREARWHDTIGYAALSAAGLVATELITRKGAETVYRSVLGIEPPPPPLSKSDKKAAKKAAKLAAKTAGQAGAAEPKALTTKA